MSEKTYFELILLAISEAGSCTFNEPIEKKEDYVRISIRETGTEVWVKKHRDLDCELIDALARRRQYLEVTSDSIGIVLG